MTLTVLDPKSALIIVDLQKAIVGSTFVHPIGDVVERSSALATAFRACGLPVVLVTVAGRAPGRTQQPARQVGALPPDFADILPALDQQPSAITVTKRTWGAFSNTDLETRLKALGVTQVVITGVATGTGVEPTARQAYELGFNVTLPVDAMTDGRTRAHDHSIVQVFPRLGETGSTNDVIGLLQQRSPA